MLTRSKQSAIVAAAALTVGLAACSSSTAPKPESASQLATHFDSIVGSLLAAGTIPDTSAAASVALLVETAPAYGSLDAPFTLTTTSGTQCTRAGPGDSPTRPSVERSCAGIDIAASRAVPT